MARPGTAIVSPVLQAPNNQLPSVSSSRTQPVSFDAYLPAEDVRRALAIFVTQVLSREKVAPPVGADLAALVAAYARSCSIGEALSGPNLVPAHPHRDCRRHPRPPRLDDLPTRRRDLEHSSARQHREGQGPRSPAPARRGQALLDPGKEKSTPLPLLADGARRVAAPGADPSRTQQPFERPGLRHGLRGLRPAIRSGRSPASWDAFDSGRNNNPRAPQCRLAVTVAEKLIAVVAARLEGDKLPQALARRSIDPFEQVGRQVMILTCVAFAGCRDADGIAGSDARQHREPDADVDGGAVLVRDQVGYFQVLFCDLPPGSALREVRATGDQLLGGHGRARVERPSAETPRRSVDRGEPERVTASSSQEATIGSPASTTCRR